MESLLLLGLSVVAGLTLIGIVATAAGAWLIARRHPPLGQYENIGEFRLHFVDLPGRDPKEPVIVFLHGASGNLRDPLLAFGDRLEQHRRIFIDRPGHGWSSRRRRGFASPRRQADAVAQLLRGLDVRRAIFVGHSWSGALIAQIGLHHRDLADGLVFVAPATHPWPGGTRWYYELAAIPIVGHVFTWIVTLPVGLSLVGCASRGVFHPETPPSGYAEKTGAALVLRPVNFRANAEDIASLLAFVRRESPNYSTIDSPTVVVTGDRDNVVWPSIHSRSLLRDIPGAELIELPGSGHMPHHTETDIVVSAIGKLATRRDEFQVELDGVAS